VQEYGYEKRPISGPIKALLNSRFGWTDSDWANREWKEAPNPRAGAPTPPGDFFSPRSWAQWLGTEMGRYIAGDDVWINLALRRLDGPVVLPDVRFDNEARAVLESGGAVIRVLRPGVAPVNAHVSEKGVSEHLIDADIHNTGSVELLKYRALARLEKLTLYV
jgi:hypothetical protein